MFSLRGEYIKRLARILKELENSDIQGLDSVILEIKNIGDSGIYEKIYDAFYQGSGKLAPETKSMKEKYLLRENYLDSKFQIMGFRNLSRPPLPIPLITDLICFPTFFTMYLFLESIYYVNLDRPLNFEDLKNLYCSNIDEQLAYNLDEFDEITGPLEITDSFFIKLKEIKWKNRISKQLFSKLKEGLKCVRMEMFGYFHVMFSNAERDFILFLAACSAIQDHRNRINQKDVVKAYKTYFKLMKTDITKYKVKLEIDGKVLNNVGNGYVVCEKCNGYYKLQDGESPEDFDCCQCGGKLRYYEDISEFENT